MVTCVREKKCPSLPPRRFANIPPLSTAKILGDQWKCRLPLIQQKFFDDKAKEEETLHKKAYPWYKYGPERKKGKKGKRDAGNVQPKVKKARITEVNIPGFLNMDDLVREYHQFLASNNLNIVHPVPEGHPLGFEKYNAPELYGTILAGPRTSGRNKRKATVSDQSRKAPKTSQEQSAPVSQREVLTTAPMQVVAPSLEQTQISEPSIPGPSIPTLSIPTSSVPISSVPTSSVHEQPVDEQPATQESVHDHSTSHEQLDSGLSDDSNDDSMAWLDVTVEEHQPEDANAQGSTEELFGSTPAAEEQYDPTAHRLGGSRLSDFLFSTSPAPEEQRTPAEQQSGNASTQDFPDNLSGSIPAAPEHPGPIEYQPFNPIGNGYFDNMAYPFQGLTQNGQGDSNVEQYELPGFQMSDSQPLADLDFGNYATGNIWQGQIYK